MKSCLAVLLLVANAAFADELSDAFDSLKKAMEAKNAEEVKKWALETSRLARPEALKPQPADASQVDYWKQRTVYAQQTDVFTEYALGATAIVPGLSPQDVQLLVEALLDQNSKSPYLEMTVGTYVNAVQKTEGTDGQQRAAARMLLLVPQSEDALVVLAEGHFTKNQMKEAGEYAARLIATMGAKPKPEGVNEAEWQRRRDMLLGRGHYIAGVSSCLTEVWAACDTNLQTARPLIESQTALQGPLFYYLAVSNYRLALAAKSRTQMQQAIAYGKQAVAIAGPLQAAARQNVGVMERALATLK